MARRLWALVALGLGATMSGGAPLEDATLRSDGDGFRLMGRLILEDGLYAVAEARYGRAFDARAELDGRVVHQEVEGRAPPLSFERIELEPPPQTTAPDLGPPPDLSLPGPRVSAGWLTGPDSPSASPVGAGELRFEPPTGPEGTGLAPPAPGIDLENPRGIRAGAPRRRGERDLTPLEVTLEGVGTATLVTDFDQRMVQQRVMPPHLSQPFRLDITLGDAAWRFRYDSGLEQFDVGAPVEDGVSAPVLEAWGRRDAEAVAETGFLSAVRRLLRSKVPVAGRTELNLVGLRFAGKAVPLEGKLYYLPGPPRSGSLQAELSRHDWQALPDLVEDRGSRPAKGATLRVRTLGSGSGLQEAATDAAGLATVALTDPSPRRLTLDVIGPRSTRKTSWAAWRWGRPIEAWLDSGRPPLPSLAAGTPEDDRLRLILRRILESYSPDDGNFHGPSGSSGFDTEDLLDILGPALRKSGETVEARLGVARAALVREVTEAQRQAGSESANWSVVDPRKAPGAGTSLKALSGGLEVARRELGQLKPNTWTLGLAAAGAKLATRLASPDAGPGAKLLEGGTRELLDALAARRGGEVHRAVVMTKAGPAEGRAFPEDEWAGRLYLALAFRAGSKAFPDSGFEEAAAEQVARLGELTRPSQAFPDSWKGKGLGTLARVLGMLVREHGEETLASELAAVRAELWSSVSGWKAPDSLGTWVDALQGWL